MKTKKRDIKLVLIDNLNNIDETKELEKSFLQINALEKERAVKFHSIKELAAIKVKKRSDKIIELQESIYNRVVLKKIHTTLYKNNAISKLKFFYFFFKVISR